MDDVPQYIPAREVVAKLSISRKTLERWINDGRIKAYQINARGDFRFRVDDVNALLTLYVPDVK